MRGTFSIVGITVFIAVSQNIATVLADQSISAGENAEHWSFTPPIRPTVPTIKAAWVRNPIDAFIAAEHEKRGLIASPEADKPTLLRRVYLDLTGLPPTREELHAFLADDSPDAYERIVDNLLASPRYGERWGRHWMDVWRYSDWAGYVAEIRDSQPFIWRHSATGSSNRSTPTRATTAWFRRCSPATRSRRTIRRSSRHRLPGPQLLQVQSQRLA